MRYNHKGVISEIDSLPGCSQICVFHSVFIPEQFRGMGFGKEAHYARLEEARLLGYQIALCTIVVGNVAQEKILLHFGWKAVKQFQSYKTKNDVQVWIKLL